MAARKRVRYKRKKSVGLLQRLLPCYPWKGKSSNNNNKGSAAVSHSGNMFTLVPVTPAECETLEVVLSTWPDDKLHDMVESAVVQANAVTNSSVLASIQQDVVAELNDKLPMKVDEQFDFCVLSAEVDCVKAVNFTKDISSKFKLLGFFVQDVMGQDKFSAVSAAIERSTKIVFYITEHFIEDEFCSHLVRNTVCLPIHTNFAARVVPVLEGPDVELPAPLRIINKVVLSNSVQFDFVMQRIFDCPARRETEERKAVLIKAIDSRRQEMVTTLVAQKLGVFV